ncbi:MAG: nuclear transport factor 2 family protein [Acidobacteria bacterium]|nr:nuclear transport factor 2 family protein [Acidobacteriota bacterium]
MKEIRQVLEKINRAWLNGRPEELAEYFHPDMVIVHPGFGGRAEGSQTCVQSYKDFTRQVLRPRDKDRGSGPQLVRANRPN